MHEIGYADLVADPQRTLAGAYDALGLGDFEAARPAVEARLDALRGYRTNAYPELEPPMVARIAERWGPIFARWGYRVPDPGSAPADGTVDVPR